MVNKKLLDFYENKKVFITGHTGFKGAWLATILVHAKAQVKGYALAPQYANTLYDTLQHSPNFESVIADIRNKDLLEKELLQFKPDIIFHLAAQPLVRRSYEIPSETFEVNVVGTGNLLESVSKLSNRVAVVIITTDKVYENKEQTILYKEEDTLGGYDPYSASKAAAEILVNSYRSSFFNPSTYTTHLKKIATARAGNVIGGCDWSTDRIIPDIVRQLQKNETVPVRSPNSIRPWQHVLEPLVGYLLLAKLMFSEEKNISFAYNFGPEEADHLTVRELVDCAIKNWGTGDWLDQSENKNVHEAKLLMLDISKAKKELDWKPKLQAHEAIAWTIEWYKAEDALKEQITLAQINEYLSR